MAGPRRRPATTAVPQISPDEAATRAARAFDAAVSDLMGDRPSRQDMALLNRLISQADPSAEDSLSSALGQFMGQRPDSCITRYYRATGATDWLIVRGRLGFNQAALRADLNTVLSPLRAQIIAQVRQLSNPAGNERSFQIDTRSMDRDVLALLQTRLAYHFQNTQLQRGRRPTAVPVTLRLTPAHRLELVSMVQAAQRQIQISDAEASRRSGG